MQSVSQATEIVSYITGTQRGRANQIARALIDADVLPKSSGRDIKKISGKELLPLLAAVAMADRVADAAKIAREFADLPLQIGNVGNNDLVAALDDAADLSSVFAAVVEKSGRWLRAEIEFAKVATGFTAMIKGDIKNVVGTLAFEVSLPFWRDASWGHFCKTSFTISAEGIENMRNLFARPDIEGMHFSLSAGGRSE